MAQGPVATVALVGFGGVGRALARRLAPGSSGGDRALPIRVVAVVDSSGAMVDRGGIDLSRALAVKDRSGRLTGPGAVALDAEEAIRRTAPDIVVQVSSSAPSHGRPAIGHILTGLREGAHVVTANKAALAFHWEEIFALAGSRSLEVRYSTTVGGGVPVLDTVATRLKDAEILRITGILNGTTQFVLSALGAGVPWVDALDRARQMGLTEADPRGDLGGNDAALKAAILSRVAFDRPLQPEAIPRTPLTADSARRIEELARRGRTLAVLSEVSREGAWVRQQEVLRGGPWDAQGAANVLRVETLHAGTVWLSGVGAGPQATASGLLADLRSVVERWGRPAGRPDTGSLAARVARPLPPPGAWRAVPAPSAVRRGALTP